MSTSETKLSIVCGAMWVSDAVRAFVRDSIKSWADRSNEGRSVVLLTEGGSIVSRVLALVELI